MDAENPPEAEESVPLHTLHPALSATTPTNQLAPIPVEKRLLDRELSDVSTVSHLERGSQGSLRRASSLEHVVMSSDHSTNNRGRIKSTGSGKPCTVPNIILTRIFIVALCVFIGRTRNLNILASRVQMSIAYFVTKNVLDEWEVTK